VLAVQRVGVVQQLQRFEVSRPAISRHLRVLRESGLVFREAKRRQRVHSLETLQGRREREIDVHIHAGGL